MSIDLITPCIRVFRLLELAIQFILASKEYKSCHEIPVHDLDRVIKVSDLGRQCTTGCAPVNALHSDRRCSSNKHSTTCLEETGTVVNQGHDYTDSENSKVKSVAQADTIG